MICQLCLASVATRHLTERSPSGRFVEMTYCESCYQAKYVEPPADSGRFPRPRFTIKNIMILGAAWTVPNAIAAWVFRSGCVIGTPAQIRLWSIETFLAVNLVLGFFVVWTYLLEWLRRVMWYKRTLGVVPMPHRAWQKVTFKQLKYRLVASVAMSVWFVAAIFLDRWLTPRVWPIQQHSPPLFALLLWAPPMLTAVVQFSRNRYIRECVRQDWRAASRQEHCSGFWRSHGRWAYSR